MRFVAGRPFGNRPEGIHHTARTVSELIREPPLAAEGRVGAGRHALKIRDPVERAKRHLAIAGIAGSRVVESFDSSEARSMAVATFVGSIATKGFPVSLFRRDG